LTLSGGNGFSVFVKRQEIKGLGDVSGRIPLTPWPPLSRIKTRERGGRKVRSQKAEGTAPGPGALTSRSPLSQIERGGKKQNRFAQFFPYFFWEKAVKSINLIATQANKSNFKFFLIIRASMI